jgi:hypothetical protein
MTLTARSTTVLLVALTLSPLGCGGGGVAVTVTTTTGTTTTTHTSSTGSTTTHIEPAEEIGRITNLEKLEVTVDGDQVDKKIDLRAGNLLETNSTGLVEFQLDVGSGCEMLQDASARVQPKPDIAVEFRDGEFWCSKRPGDPQEYEVPGGTLHADDPVFGVAIDGDQATVKVTYGSVEVRSDSGETATLAPALQVSVASGRLASQPQAVELTSADRVIADSLQARLPRPKIVPPDPSGSDALGRILQTGKLRVAIDSTDPSADDFGTAFAKSLADAWRVDVEVVPSASAAAGQGLAQESYDVVLIPGDLPASVAASQVPLFRDTAGRTWNLAVASDDVFASKLKDYVSTDVLTGAYAARYQQAIAPKVTYAPVAAFALRP